MTDENEEIQNKLIDRVADLDAARNRWIFGVFFSTFIFFVVLGVYLAPVMELSTEDTTQHFVQLNATEGPKKIETVALPNFYDMYFEFELLDEYMNDHSSVDVYIFKDEVPLLSQDAWSGSTFKEYLRETSYRNVTLNDRNPERDFQLSFRDSDTNTFYVIMHNPDEPGPQDDDTVVLQMKTYYEPLLPLVPIFFIIAFIIVLPLAIIRLYVIKQKKKELRVLLTLDLESLSDEDKLRLGIPIVPKQPTPVRKQEPQSPAVSPITPGDRN
ncbi:MAG: hypothetical protein R6V01_00135 [Thermoplasmatota archaeon]